MDVKLGYLLDENVPREMVFSENELNLVKNSKMSQFIVEKFSKVKGKKVRKNLIQVLEILLGNLLKANKELHQEIYNEYRVKIHLLHFNYHLVISHICEPDVPNV